MQGILRGYRKEILRNDGASSIIKLIHDIETSNLMNQHRTGPLNWNYIKPLQKLIVLSGETISVFSLNIVIT